MDVSGVYNNTYVLTGLHSNASYGIRLAGLSDHLPSDINEGRDGVHLGTCIINCTMSNMQ